MKTISEIAKDLNISRQAVYKKVNVQLKESLQDHIFKKNNLILIDDIGYKIIENSLILINETVSTSDNLTNNHETTADNQLKDDYLNYLKQQIELKDNLILNQQSTINSLVDKIGNMQILLKTEQEKKLIDTKKDVALDKNVYENILNYEIPPSKKLTHTRKYEENQLIEAVKLTRTKTLVEVAKLTGISNTTLKRARKRYSEYLN